MVFEIDACTRARVFIHITTISTIAMHRRMYRRTRSLVWSSPSSSSSSSSSSCDQCNSCNAAYIHLRSVLFIQHRFSSFDIVQVRVIQFFLAHCNSFEVIVFIALPSMLCSWRPFEFPMRSSFIGHHLNSFAICSRVAGDSCSAFVHSIIAIRI